MIKPRFHISTLMMWCLIAALLACWWKDNQRLNHELARYRPGNRANWSEQEATGKPNTLGAGDLPTAWASATPDGQKEWLLLHYARPIQAVSLVIHETYNPGSVYKVTAIRSSGEEIVAWEGKDPTPATAARGVSIIPLELDFACDRIRLHLDSPAFPGWNEIDAVGLRTREGRTYWASHAEASSCFGRSPANLGTQNPLVFMSRNRK